MTDVLKTVTDRFCLYSNARKGRQNGRQYVLSAVRGLTLSGTKTHVKGFWS